MRASCGCWAMFSAEIIAKQTLDIAWASMCPLGVAYEYKGNKQKLTKCALLSFATDPFKLVAAISLL